VARRTAVAQAGPDGFVYTDVANAIFLIRSLPLQIGELALKKLAPPANGTEGIARDDVCERADGVYISSPCPRFRPAMTC
jgi:hypothetical protein